MSKETNSKYDMEDYAADEYVADEQISIKKEIFSYIRIIVLAAVFAWVVSNFVIFNATIPSSSMENTIMTGSRVIGLRCMYWFNEPQQGDIIIFNYPLDESQYYIKRVVGTPGDTVEIRDGHIYINGSTVALKEDYLKEKWVSLNDGLIYEVPEGCYFVLGDNRNISQDARYWAGLALNQGLANTPEEAAKYTFVSREQVLAKAVWEYWPTIKTVK